MAQRKQYSAEFRPRNRVDVRLHHITSVAVPVQCWGLLPAAGPILDGVP